MAGIFSNRTSDSLATESGSTSATRRGRGETLSSAALMAAVERRRIVDVRRVQRRLDRARPAAARSRTPTRTRVPPCSATTAAVTRRAVISTAADGGRLESQRGR